MQTRKDVMGKVAGLVGDPYMDWLTEEYFAPLCNTAYELAINTISDSGASPYIERVVETMGVQVGVGESNLVPNSDSKNLDPLDGLMLPRFVDFKIAGSAASMYRPVREYTILPDSVQQITPGTYDIRVRGDFKPPPLTTDDSKVLIHPNASAALALSIGALIGADRNNQMWIDTYGAQAQEAWLAIASLLNKSQQHLTFRIGSPNQQGRRGIGWNSYPLQGSMGWEFRSYVLYVKLV